MYKLIAFDINGTTRPWKTKDFHPKALETFRKLSENGIKTILLTGRELFTMNDLDKTPYVDYWIGANGAKATNFKTKEGVWELAYDKKDLLALYDEFGADSKILYIDNENTYFTQLPHDDEFWLQSKDLWRELNDDTIKNDININNVTVLTFEDKPENLKNKIKEVKNFIEKRTLNLEIGAVWSFGFFVELPGVSKGYALQRLAKELNIKKGETMAFGDTVNDYELLEAAGYAVMVKSPYISNLASIADTVCDEPEELGFVKVLEDMKLI